MFRLTCLFHRIICGVCFVDEPLRFAMIRRKALGTLLVLFCAVTLSKAGFSAQLNINGLSEEQEENVRLSVGEVPENVNLRKLYVDLMPTQVQQALAAIGYYGPNIDVQTDTVNDEFIVTLNVQPNDPVRINKILLSVLGDAQVDAAYMPVLGRVPLTKNAIFNSSDYEAAKGIMIDAAQTRGYFDFKFTTNRVMVSRRAQTADIELVASSGSRYTFGNINFDQNIFGNEFLGRWTPFVKGDPYEAGKIAELTQNLQNSGYFSAVRVSPQRDPRYGKEVPVLVTLERKDSNHIGIGVGFESDTGPRAKFTWGKPLINRAGHSADAELAVSRVSQEVSFAYRIPRANQPLYNYWGIEYGLQREDEIGIKSLLSTLNFQRVRRFSNEWQESLFLRWEREIYTLADAEEERTDLVLPGVRYSRTRSRGSPFLLWGQSSSLQFMYGNRELLSTIDFYKATVNFKYLRAVTKRNTLVMSLQYGAITTNDFDRVPVTQRFYAGGDRSIRGYGYRQVGPKDPEGNPRGGRFLEVGSFEYNYRFADRWSVALFADVGRAFNNFSTSQSIGAGIGIRWQSPVGPFRLDIATPVDDPENDNVRLHLSLGPDL